MPATNDGALRNRSAPSGRAVERPPRARAGVGSHRARDVLGGRPLLALHDVELHRVTLGQRLEAAALDGAVVDEAVLRAVVGGDEAEPLRVVEPLHLAGRAHA